MRTFLMPLMILATVGMIAMPGHAADPSSTPVDHSAAAALRPLLSQAMLDLQQGRGPAVVAAVQAHPELARLWGEAPGTGWGTPVTLLHLAVAVRAPLVIDALITAGADLNASSATCSSPLFIAPTAIAELLIAKGATQTIFYLAHTGNAAQVASALTADRSLAFAVDSQGRTALHFAAEKPSLEVARLLVDAGASANAITPDGVSVLRQALGWGDARAREPARQAMVDFLLLHGALWDATSAAMAGNTKALAALVAHHPELLTWASTSLHETGMQLIHYANLGDHQSTVAWLLEHGQNVNTKDASGATPLHYACVHGSTLVTFLLAHGADASLVEKTYHCTPQGWASFFKNQAALDALAAPTASEPAKPAKSDF